LKKAQYHGTVKEGLVWTNTLLQMLLFYSDNFTCCVISGYVVI